MSQSVLIIMGEQRAAPRWMPWTLAAIAVFVLSFQLGARELSSPDETRYAAISRGMLETGDWLTPVHNFKFKHFHKPPLTYWCMAASFGALGTNDWAARLPSAAAALAAVMGVYVIGRTLHGPRAGFLAGLVLLASPLFFVLARIANSDMLLCAFITWSWVGFVRSLFGGRRQTLWFLVGALFAGLGFMTKGPVVLVSTFVPMVLYVLVTAQWKGIRWWWWLAAVGVFLVVALPWYVVVCLKNPGLLQYFVEYQTVQRLTTDVHERAEPVYFFFWLVPAGFLPWTVVVPFGIRAGLRRKVGGVHSRRVRLFLPLTWLVVVFVFITLSTSKLVTYCLPLFPALALIAGRFLARALENGHATRSATNMLMGTAFAVLLMAGVVAMFRPSAAVGVNVEWVTFVHLVSAVSMFVIGLGAVLALARRRIAIGTACLVAAVLCPLLFGAWAVAGHEDSFRVGNAGNELAALIREREETDRYTQVIVVQYRRYLMELPYYLGHSVICLDCDIERGYTRADGEYVSFYKDEHQELFKQYYRENGRRHLEQLMGLREKRVLAVTDRESYDDISTAFMMDGEPLVHLIAEVGEFVLCSNYPDSPPDE